VRTGEKAELAETKRRDHQLESELAATRRAMELVREVAPPKVRFATVATMVAEGTPVDLACRVHDLSTSGYYASRHRSLSPRQIRHTLLTEMIRRIHAESRGTYGNRRVHAELVLGRGLRIRAIGWSC
jgi:putative transposase